MRRVKKQKKSSRMALVIPAAFLLCLLLGVAVYLLPCYVYYEIETAIADKDAGKLESYIDMAELRQNLKLQRGQKIIKDLKKEEGQFSEQNQTLVDLSIQWSALHSDREIDQAISTGGFIHLLGGRDKAVKRKKQVGLYQTINKIFESASFHYESPSEFIVNAKDEKGRYVQYFSFILVREGIHWRLANVILPVF